MKKNKTPVQVISILDMSGSMAPLQSEVVGAYNHFIEEQKKQEGKAEVTLVMFDNKIITHFDRVNIKKVNDITLNEYKPRGMTALYDAVGKTIDRFSEYKDVVMIIQTDGQENASKIYDQPTLKRLIEQKEKDGWDITFLGANIDAKAAGSSIGVALHKSIQYNNTADGLQEAFACMSAVSVNYRQLKLGEE